jgi:hypothetical protein
LISPHWHHLGRGVLNNNNNNNNNNKNNNTKKTIDKLKQNKSGQARLHRAVSSAVGSCGAEGK